MVELIVLFFLPPLAAQGMVEAWLREDRRLVATLAATYLVCCCLAGALANPRFGFDAATIGRTAIALVFIAPAVLLVSSTLAALRTFRHPLRAALVGPPVFWVSTFVVLSVLVFPGTLSR